MPLSGVVAFLLAVLGAAALHVFVDSLDLVLCWLIAVTAATFGAYGYDKAAAASNWRRIPESVLLALALVGGTLGALAGMLLFRHKTAKKSFRLKFLGILILQAVAAAAYYHFFVK